MFDLEAEPKKALAKRRWARAVAKVLDDDLPLFRVRKRGSVLTTEEQAAVVRYLPLVRATARRAELRGIVLDDLEGELIAYTCHVIPRFDPGRASLGSLLRVALANKIKNMIRDASRRVRARTDQQDHLDAIADRDHDGGFEEFAGDF